MDHPTPSLRFTAFVGSRRLAEGDKTVTRAIREVLIAYRPNLAAIPAMPGFNMLAVQTALQLHIPVHLTTTLGYLRQLPQSLYDMLGRSEPNVPIFHKLREVAHYLVDGSDKVYIWRGGEPDAFLERIRQYAMDQGAESKIIEVGKGEPEK